MANAEEPLLPTDAEVQSFTLKYDGTTRPDLVSSWTRIQLVLGNDDVLNVLRRTLTSEDLATLNAFRQRAAEVDVASDKLFSEMLGKLCRDIANLNGLAIAERVAQIDSTIEAHRSAAVRGLLDSLTPRSAEAVAEQGLKAASRVSGSHTDILAFASQFPDYVKAQFTERCFSFGLIKREDRN